MLSDTLCSKKQECIARRPHPSWGQLQSLSAQAQDRCIVVIFCNTRSIWLNDQYRPLCEIHARTRQMCCGTVHPLVWAEQNSESPVLPPSLPKEFCEEAGRCAQQKGREWIFLLWYIFHRIVPAI